MQVNGGVAMQESWRMNSFQKWAKQNLERNGYTVEMVANWIRVNDELDLMSYQGVQSYIDYRR